MDEDEDEWAIIRLPVSKDLVVVRVWGRDRYIQGILLARGFKTNQEAMFYLPLYNEDGK